MANGNKGGINLLPFKIYGIGYAIITILAIISGFAGKYETDPQKFVSTFKVAPDSFLRVAANYTFQASTDATVVLSAGERVNEYVARELVSLIKQNKFPYKQLELYKDGWFWNLNWGSIFTVYNLLGLFVGLYFGLKGTVAQMLDEAGAKTATALSNARTAQAEAKELSQKYDTLLSDLNAEKERLSAVLKDEQEIEKEKIMQQAKHEADGIVKSVKLGIDGEIQAAAERLRTEVASRAVAKAREILASEITTQDHENAFNDFISDLEQTSK